MRGEATDLDPGQRVVRSLCHVVFHFIVIPRWIRAEMSRSETDHNEQFGVEHAETYSKFVRTRRD